MRTVLDVWADVGKSGVDVRVSDGRSGVLIEPQRIEFDNAAAGERLVDELVAAMTEAARAVLKAQAAPPPNPHDASTPGNKPGVDAERRNEMRDPKIPASTADPGKLRVELDQDDAIPGPEMPAWVEAWEGSLEELLLHLHDIVDDVAEHLFATKREAFDAGCFVGEQPAILDGLARKLERDLGKGA